MKAYYISNITGNKCTVTTPSEFYTETLSIEDLQEFSKTNIVLGYNKLTKSVAIKAEDDVYNYINSKKKLSGAVNKIHKMGVYVIEKATEINYNKSTGAVTVSIDVTKTEGIDTECLITSYYISWDDVLFNNMKKKLSKRENTILI